MDSSQMLATLLLYGLMGLLGQGIRAAIGLKNAAALESNVPGQQSGFNASYFMLSMMIGFIVGVLAGIGMMLNATTAENAIDVKDLLPIVIAGYAGVDFIENAATKIIPGLGAPANTNANSSTKQTPDAAAVTAMATQLNTLTNMVSVLAQTKAPPSPVPVAPAEPTTAMSSLPAALKVAAPAVSATTWLAPLTAAFTKFDMTSSRRIAAAIGQFLVEAGAAFQDLVENLNYTHADRLVDVFPNEFPTVNDAAPFVGKPEAIANRVYANRNGNGAEASGDGFLFRGRGLIQLTGRTTYTEFGTVMGMTPEQAAAYCETPTGAAMSGCWFLASHGCLHLADAWALSAITGKVNGPKLEGNTQRINYSNAMLKALGG